MLRVSNRQAVTPIAQRQEFKNHTDSLRGLDKSQGLREERPIYLVGWLSNAWANRLREERPIYLVYSYMTPIAWWSEEHGWTVVDASFSPTTSRHQHIVRMAVH